MSSSPALAQLSPDRSPSFSSALPRSPTRETPSTPSAPASCLSNAPPTPPDSSSRVVLSTASSPRFTLCPKESLVASLSSTLSAAAPQFQSRLLDMPIDLHELSSEFGSPTASKDSVSPGAHRDNTAAAYNIFEQDSPTSTQDVREHKAPQAAALPPPFVPASARAEGTQEQVQNLAAPPQPPSPSSHPPNVYINGLPPNFPEEDLLAMTRPFGNVLSVRTFTRHVSDKPSGYGFVLFERLDSAEKCIESLRKYRNLHPSFSKQVHKIPGTVYASAPSACATGPADSFKSKMEQLRDESSTNLYMEGLPLSVCDEDIRVLVAPYRIMSSRFFTTRLSNPPRIIAFVRLETRTAAEDIIERLHGRLVRGSNDTGCRISVRFADTAEQRELRRTERHGREDEQSPARLTMARAALLNLKGTQYQAHIPTSSVGGIDMASLPNSPSLGLALNNLSLGQLAGALSPPSGPSPLQTQGSFAGTAGRSQGFGSLSSAPSAFDALNAQAAHFASPDLRLPQQAFHASASDLLDDPSQLQLALMSMQGLRTNSAQQGYTPVEQLILQAHARQRANAENRSGRLQDSYSSAGSRASGVPSAGRNVNRRLLDCLPQMSEDDFHAAANFLQDNQRAGQTFSGEQDGAAKTRQRNHTLATQVRGDGGGQALHTRSSTLPSQYLSMRNSTAAPALSHIDTKTLYDTGANPGSNPVVRQQTRTSIMNNVPRTISKHTPHTHSIDSNAQRHTNTNSLSPNPQTNTHTLFTSKSNINLPSATARVIQNGASVAAATPSATHTVGPNHGATATLVANGAPAGVREVGDHADVDEESPVVSPALTYSARTPVTLSPATPYSGFFSDGGEGFKANALRAGPGVEGADMMPPMKHVVEKAENLMGEMNQ
ncbi:hypothetical protein C2E23DRAFT_181506 [Lenzites betulinus]|nr:hypothetical protein C2E23DRAFT_181506 [Lenzites betulinus]